LTIFHKDIIVKEEEIAMNIKDFSYIAAVVEYGSYSKAAEALYLSQPSLSAYIRGLEKQLGIRFFKNDRSSLTPEGELYLSYARKIIDLDARLTKELQQMKRTKNQQYRIGMTLGRSDQYLDTIYYKFNQPDSDCSVDISIDTSQNLVQKVLDGQLDIILLNAPQNTQNLSCQTIFTDHLLLAVHNDNPVTKTAYAVSGSKYRHLPETALRELSYILYPKGRTLRTLFDTLCKHKDITPKIVQEVPSIRSACRLVSHGLGATFMFDIPQELSYLGEEAACYYVDIKELAVDFVAAYSKSCPDEKAYKKVIKKIKEAILKE